MDSSSKAPSISSFTLVFVDFSSSIALFCRSKIVHSAKTLLHTNREILKQRIQILFFTKYFLLFSLALISFQIHGTAAHIQAFGSVTCVLVLPLLSHFIHISLRTTLGTSTTRLYSGYLGQADQVGPTVEYPFH